MVARTKHLTDIHKFGECNQSKKFYRADHFRQHLKHSHAGTSGKWTNMLENSCMKEEPLVTDPPEPILRILGGSSMSSASGSSAPPLTHLNSATATIGSQAQASLYSHQHQHHHQQHQHQQQQQNAVSLSPSQQLQAQAQQAQQMQQQQNVPVAMMGPSGLRHGPYPLVPPGMSSDGDMTYQRLEDNDPEDL